MRSVEDLQQQLQLAKNENRLLRIKLLRFAVAKQLQQGSRSKADDTESCTYPVEQNAKLEIRAQSLGQKRDNRARL